ncbi:MAG: MmgE/PrpD family protein [Actinomycetota bacterium]
MVDPRYRTAFLDWLACAVAGSGERAALAAVAADPDGLGRVVSLGTAGHALDFDDTYAPGLVHCTAPVAPAALVLAADLDASVGAVMAAHAAGFEAMAALARASHPELYRRGWHPTAVCGVVGAASAAASVLGLDEEGRDRAVRLALLQSAGLRGAFGSDGKALQVGMASAAGARAALLARAGASATADLPTGEGGFEAAYGAAWTAPDPAEPPAIVENWIKAYPCCLQTHAAIEAADTIRQSGATVDGAQVRVHPISLHAAPHGVPADALQAKFSIPYTVAFTALHGPPGVEDFRRLDDDAVRLASRIEVTPDSHLAESEAIVEGNGVEPIRVRAALGSPQRPMSEDALRSKVISLAGDGLDALVVDDVPARKVLDAVMVRR